MILMVIIKFKSPFRFEKNLEFVENIDNSPKYEILSSILFLVFTGTVWHGQDRTCTKAWVLIDRLKKKRHSQLLPGKV